MSRLLMATGMYLIIAGLSAIIALSEKSVMFVGLGLLFLVGCLQILFDESLANILGQQPITIRICAIAWVIAYLSMCLVYWLSENNVYFLYCALIPVSLVIVAILIYLLYLMATSHNAPEIEEDQNRNPWL